MALFLSSPRSHSLLDQVFIQKIDKIQAFPKMAQFCDQIGDINNDANDDIKPSNRQNRGEGDASDSGDPLNLTSRTLSRNFSVESNTSVGSATLGEDVCHCDDCFLGITDLYFVGSKTVVGAKKVSIWIIKWSSYITRSQTTSLSNRLIILLNYILSQITSNNF